MRSGTTPAMRCCARSPRACAPGVAGTTRWPAWAATSSRSSWRVCGDRATPAISRRRYWRPCSALRAWRPRVGRAAASASRCSRWMPAIRDDSSGMPTARSTAPRPATVAAGRNSMRPCGSSSTGVAGSMPICGAALCRASSSSTTSRSSIWHPMRRSVSRRWCAGGTRPRPAAARRISPGRGGNRAGGTARRFVLRQAALARAVDRRRAADRPDRGQHGGPAVRGRGPRRAVGQAWPTPGSPAELLEIEVTEACSSAAMSAWSPTFSAAARGAASRSRWTISAPATPRSRTCGGSRSTSSRSTDPLSPTCSTTPTTPRSSAAIIELGHSLGLKIVAEGVETEAQLEFLARHRCDQMQGYLIAAPAPAAEAMERAAAHRPVPMLPARRRLRG